MPSTPLVPLVLALLTGALCRASVPAPEQDGPRLDRAAAVGVWVGVMGSRARGATLLRIRLTLETGLEVAEEPGTITVEPDPEEQAARDEARARAEAIRSGRDPESAGRNVVREDASSRRAEEFAEARLRRERQRADRLEGVLEFTPFYGPGEIRRGLGGVPSVDDATGRCAVVGFLNPHAGTLELRLVRWLDRPEKNLLGINTLQLVLDPGEELEGDALFGDGETGSSFADTGAFTPVLAWREGQAPESTLDRLTAIAYPNTFSGEFTPAGSDRLARLRRAITSYDRDLASLEKSRPVDTIELDFADDYARLEQRLEDQLATNQRNYETAIARADKEEADLDAREQAGGLKDSELRRIASKRESLEGRRERAKEQLESRDQQARERSDRERAKLDERVAAEREELAEEMSEHAERRAELERSRPSIERTANLDNAVLRSWIGRVREQVPEAWDGETLDFTSASSASHALLNALRDDVLVETFGAPYAELTDADMLVIADYLIGRQDVVRDHGEADDGAAAGTSGRVRRRGADVDPDAIRDQAQREREAMQALHEERSARQQAENDERRELIDGLRQPLRNAFGREYERNVLRHAVQRRTLAWVDHVRAELDALRPDADTFVRLDALERALAHHTHHLRQAEQDEAMLLVIQARRAHADPTAIALAQRLSTNAAGQQGIATLSYFWSAQPALDRLVSDDARATVDATIDEGLDRLIRVAVESLRERIRRLDATDDPYDALALGASIYRDFRTSIGAATRRPIARTVLDAITARRPADLLAVREAVSARILAAETLDEAQRIASTAVMLPSDSETKAGEYINLSVSLRAVQLERDALLALLSERERLLLDETTGRIEVPSGYAAPTAEEVRLATLRAFARDGGRMLDPSSCLHAVPGLGTLDVTMRMELDDVRIVRAEQRDDGGYTVIYTFRRRMSPEGAMRTLVNDSSWQGELLLDMLDGFGDNLVETTAEVFLLTPAGWQSPTLLARLDLASAMQPLRVLTGERRAR